MTDYTNMLAALTANYLDVYTVSPDQDRGEALKVRGQLVEPTRDFTYSQMLSTFAHGQIHPEDVDYFLQMLGKAHLLEYFSTGAKQLEISYRSKDGSGTHFYSASYIRISHENEPLCLLAAFCNIDPFCQARTKNTPRDFCVPIALLLACIC